MTLVCGILYSDSHVLRAPLTLKRQRL